MSGWPGRAWPGLVLVLLTSCDVTPAAPAPEGSGEEPGWQGETTQLRCEPASSTTCYCVDGSTHEQTCQFDGRYAPCPCTDGSALSTATPSGIPVGAARLCEALADSGGCEARSYGSARLSASILFLVDRSGSMACNDGSVQSSEECELAAAPADPGKPSKWEITTTALSRTFDSLADDAVRAGVSFFSVDDVCAVRSAPDVAVQPLIANQLVELERSLEEVGPGGGTPLVGATILAYRHLHQEAMAPGNRYVVLITDGEESCPDASANLARLLDEEVDKALQANIRTFVIGAPGSEGARAFLSELAFRSGTSSREGCLHGGPDGDCHFDMTREPDFAESLERTLLEISGRTLGCEFPVPAGEGGGQDVNVQLTEGGGGPECLPRDDSAPCAGGAHGWQFARQPDGRQDLGKVVLCGDACARFEASSEASVDVVLGCVSLI